MRCNSCNVDLEDDKDKCPLCGKPAVNEKPHIVRARVPYPEIKPQVHELFRHIGK